MAFIDAHRDCCLVAAVCRVLDLSERSYCAARVRPPCDREATDAPHRAEIRRVFEARESEFLAYFATGAIIGRTEGANRVIKHINRLRCGFTNTHNYRLRILCRSTPPATAHPAAA